MAEYQESPQAVVGAVLESAPLTGLKERDRELALRIRQESNKTPREAIKELENSALQKRVGEGQPRVLLVETFGTAPRAAGTPEANRLNQAEAVTRRAQRLADIGYEALRRENAADAAEIRRSVEVAMMRWPGARELMRAMTATQRRAEVERILNDANFRPKIVDFLKNALDPANTENYQGFIDAKKKISDANSDIEKKQKEAQDALIDLEQKQLDLNRYTNVPGVGLGERLQVWQNMHAENLEAQIVNRNNEIAANNTQITQLTNERPGANAARRTEIDNQIRILRTQNTNLNNDIEDNLRKRITDRNTLRTEIDNKVSTLQPEIRKLTRDRDAANAAVAALENRRNGYQTVIAGFEEDLIQRLNEASGRAAMQHLADEVRAKEANQKSAAEQLRTEAKTMEEANFANALKRRWETREIRRSNLVGKLGPALLGRERMRKLRVEKARIRQDFNTMLRQGPDAVVRDIFRASNPRLTPAEIDQKINDKDFMDRVRPQVVDQLLTKKYQIGGINRAEAQAIVADNENGTTLIETAFANKDTMQQTLNDLKEKGYIANTTWESVRQAVKKHPKLAMLIVGAAAAGIGAAAIGSTVGFAAAGEKIAASTAAAKGALGSSLAAAGEKAGAAASAVGDKLSALPGTQEVAGKIGAAAESLRNTGAANQVAEAASAVGDKIGIG